MKKMMGVMMAMVLAFCFAGCSQNKEEYTDWQREGAEKHSPSAVQTELMIQELKYDHFLKKLSEPDNFAALKEEAAEMERLASEDPENSVYEANMYIYRQLIKDVEEMNEKNSREEDRSVDLGEWMVRHAGQFDNIDELIVQYPGPFDDIEWILHYAD